MNILVTLDNKYMYQLKILINSLEKSNIDEKFNIYVVHRTLVSEDFEDLKKYIDNSRINIIEVKIDENVFKDFPVVEKRYPIEIYFRLYAAKYLPNDVDRILYLDPDIVVINSLDTLYNMDFKDNYFIATTHTKQVLKEVNRIRLNLDKEKDINYINTGVILMNINKLRDVDINKDIECFFNNNKKRLILPDQDILTTLYGDKTIIVDDLIYNLCERRLNLYNVKIMNINEKRNKNWVRNNAVIVHYCGRNKPWNKNYIGILKIFYKEIENKMLYNYNKKYKK